MPTENNPIDLSSGTMCFKSGEGETWLPVNGVQEAPLEPYADTAPRIIGVDLAKEASFTCTMKVPAAVYYSFKRYEKWCKMLRKYIHLARHGKNRRIRKKNMIRFVEVYTEGELSIKKGV